MPTRSATCMCCTRISVATGRAAGRSAVASAVGDPTAKLAWHRCGIYPSQSHPACPQFVRAACRHAVTGAPTTCNFANIDCAAAPSARVV
eukprot:scaffold56192_cov75-Phaeocystis_antarctica.AAC.2